MKERGSHWIDDTLRGLSLEKLVAQMISVRGESHYAAADDPAHIGLRAAVDRGVGGVSFFQGNVAGQLALTRLLIDRAEIPLLFAQDVEYGLGMRLDDGLKFPSMMAVGATGDVDVARRVGRAIGEESLALGVLQVFGPVADVNSNAANPIINVRSFGEDPTAVASMVVASVEGLRAAGAIATVKHFPGHGDTQIDSHVSLPVLNHDMDRLMSVELVPFAAAIEAGVDSVMVGHLSVAAVGDPPELPASLSPRVTTGLLRDRLGFAGLVVTDAMDMGAIVSTYGTAEAAIRAVEAGNDMIVLPADTGVAIGAVVNAVNTGRIGGARIESSVRRILACKESGAAPGDYESAQATISCGRHRELAAEVARKAISVVEFVPGSARLGSRGNVLVVVAGESGVDHSVFTGRLNELTTGENHVYRSPGDGCAEAEARLYEDADRADAVVFAAYVPVRAWSGQLGLAQAQSRILSELVNRNGQTVVVSFGSPYVIGSITPGAFVATYSDCPASQIAAAELLASAPTA